jgi:hypothetical protein
MHVVDTGKSESVAQNSKQRGDSFEGGDGSLPHFPHHFSHLENIKVLIICVYAVTVSITS